MIAFVEGTLSETGDGFAVISAGGLGYIIQTSARDLAALPPVGSFVKMHTALIVREDEMSLYGFLKKDELELFRMLIQVSGTGPRAALAILSALSTDELVMAIVSEDSKAISKAQGVGARTAGRIILDLKDKIDIEEYIGSDNMETAISADQEQNSASFNDVVLALTSLGYSRSEALRAVRDVNGASEMSSEKLLKEALRHII